MMRLMWMMVFYSIVVGACVYFMYKSYTNYRLVKAVNLLEEIKYDKFTFFCFGTKESKRRHRMSVEFYVTPMEQNYMDFIKDANVDFELCERMSTKLLSHPELRFSCTKLFLNDKHVADIYSFINNSGMVYVDAVYNHDNYIAKNDFRFILRQIIKYESRRNQKKTEITI